MDGPGCAQSPPDPTLNPCSGDRAVLAAGLRYSTRSRRGAREGLVREETWGLGELASSVEYLEVYGHHHQAVCDLPGCHCRGSPTQGGGDVDQVQLQGVPGGGAQV